jgi:hypothetical protein
MKRFKGFTPEQQFTLLGKMGYSGPMNQTEMSNFIQSNPEAQARLGKFAEAARKRIEAMSAPKGFAEGGMVYSTKGDDPILQSRLDSGKMSQDQIDKLVGMGQLVASKPQSSSTSTGGNTEGAEVPPDLIKAQEQTKTALENPTSMVTPANIQQVVQDPNQFIQPGTGDAGQVQTGQATTVTDTQTAATPERTEAAQVDPTKVTDQVRQEAANLEAAQAQPTAAATVRGQLEMLMQDFEGGGTPPWASGAMREAMSVMQRRGMGASSMAGAAVVQAAMESAIGIASQDAATTAQFEMQNLNNRQQTAIFKTQQTIAGMFSDQAADNAAKQFNAASKNQVNQFFADLESTVSRFNADQVNAIRRFNAGEQNAMEQFNTSLKAAREEFNAKNDLIIAQANTKWRQDIATMDTAAQNEANMEFARTANALTARALDQIWQKERDIMAFAFTSSESAAQRKHELLIGDKRVDAQKDQSRSEAIGYIAGRLLFG